MGNLLNNNLKKRFAEIGCQDGNPNATVVMKLFNAYGAGSWFCTELVDEDTCFAYVTGLGVDEWGYVSLKELSEVRHPKFGFPLVERDLYSEEMKLSEHLPELAEEIERKEELRKLESQKQKENDLDVER